MCWKSRQASKVPIRASDRDTDFGQELQLSDQLRVPLLRPIDMYQLGNWHPLGVPALVLAMVLTLGALTRIARAARIGGCS